MESANDVTGWRAGGTPARKPYTSEPLPSSFARCRGRQAEFRCKWIRREEIWDCAEGVRNRHWSAGKLSGKATFKRNFGKGNFGIDIFTKCKYTEAMKFEWDEEKRLANAVKHGVDFTDACRLFEGPFMTMTDNRRDYGEIRIIAFGHV